jgi:hypothetical protein
MTLVALLVLGCTAQGRTQACFGSELVRNLTTPAFSLYKHQNVSTAKRHGDIESASCSSEEDEFEVVIIIGPLPNGKDAWLGLQFLT